MDLECTSGKKGGSYEGGGRAHPPRARPPASWGPRSSTHIYLRTLKLLEEKIDREFRRRKPL